MKIDIGLLLHDLNQIPALARAADEMNFDGLWTFETAHEAFLPLVLAAEMNSAVASSSFPRMIPSRQPFTRPRSANKFLSMRVRRPTDRSSTSTVGEKWQSSSAVWQHGESGTKCPL